MSTTVTLTEAKNHLRIEHNDEDASITHMLQAAEAAFKHFSGQDTFPETPDARLAVLIAVTYWYTNRGDDEQTGDGMLPKAFYELARNYRNWSF